MSAQNELQGLSRYLPEGAIDRIVPLLRGYSLHIKITRPRKSKLGDYRALRNAKFEHVITLNNDLNPYSFLITLLHEMAHMYTFSRHKSRVKPHGQEWKQYYSWLLDHFLDKGYFPEELEMHLKQHLQSPSAASCTDLKLYRLLKNYNETETDNGLTLLETLEDGILFKWRNGMIFRKEQRLRKRFRCIEVRTKKTWLFHPMAEVERLDI